MDHHVISAEELANRLEAVHVFDIRWRLGTPEGGRESYLAGHIPGAVFVDLDRDLSAVPGQGGRHPLPDPGGWAGTLGRLGLTPGDDVVVYDDSSGQIAARMWWMLQSIGHPSVRVLDGGFQAWARSGLPISTEVPDVEPAEYGAVEQFTGVVSIGELGGRNLIDVRASERYEGIREPVDPRAGHIPGAVNLPSTLNLSDDLFKDPRELKELYGELRDPVVSCGSGVVACHTALAIARTGRPVPDVYVGSYSEWSRSDRPIVTGPTP